MPVGLQVVWEAILGNKELQRSISGKSQLEREVSYVGIGMIIPKFNPNCSP